MRKNATAKDIPAKIKQDATESPPRNAGGFPLLELSPNIKFACYIFKITRLNKKP